MVDINKDDIAFVKANYKTMSVPDMAKRLKRGNTTIYSLMKELNLDPMKRVITSSHPFKRANRKLETQLLHNRLVLKNYNDQRKKQK